MIKISKGGLVLEVTSGAYKVIYKAAGWSPVDETPAAAPQTPPVGVSGAGGSNPTPEDHTTPEKPQEDHTGEEETLNKMSDDELRQSVPQQCQHPDSSDSRYEHQNCTGTAQF